MGWRSKRLPVFHRPLKSAEAVNEIRVIEELEDGDMLGEHRVKRCL